LTFDAPDTPLVKLVKQFPQVRGNVEQGALLRSAQTVADAPVQFNVFIEFAALLTTAMAAPGSPEAAAAAIPSLK
jgi:hypothetical protein